MKKIDVENAVGMVLCHDITAMYDGFKGAAFKRGHVIAEEDVEKLLNYGKKSIFVWEDNAGEVHEEDCALRMSLAAPMEGGHYSAVSEGKINLIPDVDGMFRVDKELLKELNSIPDITVSTVPDHFPVKAGKRAASMRIIPLVTKEENIAKFEELCKGKSLFRLFPYRSLKVGIIITGSELFSGRTKDKFEEVARRKLSKYPSTLIGCEICDDKPQMITDTAHRFLEMGADVLFFSGGMSVDPDDVTPASIKALGGEIVTYGVPAQPGNMTLVSYLGDVPLIGVPGASVSCTTTMFDVVLPQIFSGEKFTIDELTSLGEGGLCMQCPACHFPNCTFGRY